ncbi:MAG: FAD binding domain-containing protein [Acidobacteriota bacterium]
MRNQVSFFLNGEPVDVSGAEAALTLSDFLREHRRMTGTKVVCAEGDCGACTVLCARPRDGMPFRYRSLDSCIQFVYQLDGAHVVTVEGLSDGDELHPVQQSMVDHFGSQCGFCTPGFVGALTELAEVHSGGSAMLEESALRRGLTGNLCRCTGYVQILEAGRSLDLASYSPLSARYDEEAIASALRERCADSAGVPLGGATAYLPRSLPEALALRAAHPEARIVAGATDLGVQNNKGRLPPGDRIVLGGVPELRRTSREENCLSLGAAASWSAVRRAVAEDFPQFDRLLDLFGAPQIRHAGTLGGNLMNASPIADSLPFYFVTDSIFEVAGLRGARYVAAADFYKGYKETALAPDELLVRVKVPLEAAADDLRLLKVSRRRDLDISTFTAALLLRTDGDRITVARVALGGVGPVVLRLPRTERLLEGETLSEELFARAGAEARSEIEPISDVRGAADYRLRLAENALRRFGFETLAEREGESLPQTTTAVASESPSPDEVPL